MLLTRASVALSLPDLQRATDIAIDDAFGPFWRDVGRPWDGIRFQVTGGRLRIEATDGHVAMRRTYPLLEPAPAGGEAIVPCRVVKEVLKAVRTRKGGDVLHVEIEATAAGVSYRLATDQLGAVWAGPSLEGTWPGMERVIPLHIEGVSTFGAEAFGHALKAMESVYGGPPAKRASRTSAGAVGAALAEDCIVQPVGAWYRPDHVILRTEAINGILFDLCAVPLAAEVGRPPGPIRTDTLDAIIGVTHVEWAEADTEPAWSSDLRLLRDAYQARRPGESFSLAWGHTIGPVILLQPEFAA